MEGEHLKQSLFKGFKAGLETTWVLGKVIFPVTLIVSLIQYTPLIDWIVNFISPAMGIFGLNGDAAIPLVIGNFLNLYAAIGAILSFDFTVKEVFILAVMLSFSHNLLIETSVASKVGVKAWIILLVRLGLAFFSAFIIHLFWQGGGEKARYGFIAPSTDAPSEWGEIILNGLEKAAMGVVQLAVIVIPLMILIQIMKDLGWVDKFSKMMEPMIQLLGMRKNTSTTLAAGLIFGLAYGAGVMIQAAKEDGVERRDLTLALIFLVACHAVVEDTLIFVPLGIPVWPLLCIRLMAAVFLTMAVGFFWKKGANIEGKGTAYEHKHHSF